jgi:hypothetical protein
MNVWAYGGIGLQTDFIKTPEWSVVLKIKGIPDLVTSLQDAGAG